MKRPVEVPKPLAVPPGEANPAGFADRCVWTDRMLQCLSQGGPEGGKWYWLHDKVFRPETLAAAYAKVARNGGAPGVDNVSIKSFSKRLDAEINRVVDSWQAGTFRPQLVLRRYIAKPGSTQKRPLGIPTVRDRMVEGAMRIVLEPIFEMDFHPNSYGFRPGRSAQQALAHATRAMRSGAWWVVDADIQGYFDHIPHGKLLEVIRRRVTDRRLLGLIEAYLKAGVLDGETEYEPESGSPQGGVISPLLANIYLNDLDHLVARRGYTMIRYADDFLILCYTEEDARRALALVQDWMCGAELTLHPEKTRIVNLNEDGNHVDFLGYRFKRHRIKRERNRTDDDDDGAELVLLRLIRPKSLDKVKQTIRQLTPRTCGCSLDELIQRLNRSLAGWFRYFRSAHSSHMKSLDQMIRRRLRAILAKRRKRPCWGGGHCHNRWPNAFFAHHGLFSLATASDAYLQPHRRTR